RSGLSRRTGPERPVRPEPQPERIPTRPKRRRIELVGEAAARLAGIKQCGSRRWRRSHTPIDAARRVRAARACARWRFAMRLKASAWALTAALVFAPATPAFAYLKFGVTVNGQAVTLKWANTPARYYVTDRGASGLNPTDIQAAVGRAFATWQAVPTASISYQFAGFTLALPGEDDGISTLGFVSRPELTR